MADAGACDRAAESNKTVNKASRYHVRESLKKQHKHCTFRHIYGIINVPQLVDKPLIRKEYGVKIMLIKNNK